MEQDSFKVQQPAIVQFSKELADAQASLENSVSDMLDVLRWRTCLRHGFPKPTSSASSGETLWTVNGTHYAATPTGAVDAVLREELGGKNIGTRDRTACDSERCTDTIARSVRV